MKEKKIISFYRAAVSFSTNVGIDWGLLKDDYVYENVHKILPLVLSQHPKCADENLSSQEKKTLKNLGYFSELEYENQFNHVNQILKKLAKENIDVIFLKGFALNTCLYENNKRLSSDIDILVEHKNYEKTLKILSESYECKSPSNKKPFEGLYESTWVNKLNKKIVLDIHFELIQSSLFNITYENIWKKRKYLTECFSNNAYTMSISHQIVHLVLHIFKDYYLYHYSLVDIANIIHRYKMDTNECLLIAKKFGCKTISWTVFKIMQEENLININEKSLYIYRPNAFRRLMIRLFLVSRFNHKWKKHSLMYRVTQLIFQYLFTDCITQALRNQTTYLVKKIRGEVGN